MGADSGEVAGFAHAFAAVGGENKQQHKTEGAAEHDEEQQRVRPSEAGETDVGAHQRTDRRAPGDPNAGERGDQPTEERAAAVGERWRRHAESGGCGRGGFGIGGRRGRRGVGIGGMLTCLRRDCTIGGRMDGSCGVSRRRSGRWRDVRGSLSVGRSMGGRVWASEFRCMMDRESKHQQRSIAWRKET